MLAGLARLGRDMEVRYTQAGEAVGTLSLAYNYGKKGSDGKRPTQWIDAALWGDRVDKLGQYLLKGKLLYVVLDDVHIETYEKKDGTTGSALRARVGQIEFAGGKDDEQQARPAKPEKAAGGGAAALDDDVPFAPLGYGALSYVE